MAACTFHKLGKDIIAEVEGKQPTPAPWEDSPADQCRLHRAPGRRSAHDPEFLSHWLLFRTVCFRPNRELAQFKDQRDYDRYLREVGEERDGHRGILTLNGELVRSMEEVAIANWLYLNGVNYQYERAYEFETADRQHRQYFPDFYYPDIEPLSRALRTGRQRQATAPVQGRLRAGRNLEAGAAYGQGHRADRDHQRHVSARRAIRSPEA